MIHKTGNMFTTDARAIGHGCNTRGVMGAGVAAIIRSQFPVTYDTYRHLCNTQGVLGGEVLVTHEQAGDDDIYIFNMMTQIDPGPDARLDLVAMAAQDAADKARVLGLDRIAIPQIGCGIGGLVWRDVEPLLEATEGDGFEWEVWTL